MQQSLGQAFTVRMFGSGFLTKTTKNTFSEVAAKIQNAGNANPIYYCT